MIYISTSNSSQAQAENLHVPLQVTCQTPMQPVVEGICNHNLMLLVSLVLRILLVHSYSIAYGVRIITGAVHSLVDVHECKRGRSIRFCVKLARLLLLAPARRSRSIKSNRTPQKTTPIHTTTSFRSLPFLQEHHHRSSAQLSLFKRYEESTSIFISTLADRRPDLRSRNTSITLQQSSLRQRSSFNQQASRYSHQLMTA
jgi:hypothetical protein